MSKTNYMNTVKAYCDDLALSPKYVMALNEIGIDTTMCPLYWSHIQIAGKDFWSIETKDYIPYELGENETDAPTFIELMNVLRSELPVDGIMYHVSVSFKSGHTEISYIDSSNIVLHTESDIDPNVALFNMIMWCVENNYQLNNKDI